MSAGGVYKCMQENTGEASGSNEGPNEFIAKKLDEMHDLYEAAIGKSQFSKQAYRKGESTTSPRLIRQRQASCEVRVSIQAWLTAGTVVPIRTKAEALELKGIGDNLATRVSVPAQHSALTVLDRRNCYQQPVRSSLLRGYC